jgi:hypothetical protein
MVVLAQSNSYECGVPLPVRERVRERVPGFDPTEFWQDSPGSQAWASMLGKYEALAHAARLAGGPRDDAYRATLTELSSRWPGALREGELIGPRHVEARRAAAEAGTHDPDRARGEWLAGDAVAVICWAELHALIRDQLEFRRTVGPRGSSEAFAEWLAARGVERTARWPRPERIATVVGPKLRVRNAYLWLAARVGLDLPALNEVLLARAGHWDRRHDDPEWSRSG